MSFVNLRDRLAKEEGRARQAAIALRSVFLAYIRDQRVVADMDDDPELFHEILTEAKNHDWVHYSRLATGMGLTDVSNSSRWFKDGPSRKSPDKFRRRFALAALARIVETDIERIRKAKEPIGHLSMKDFGKLEFEVPLVTG